MVKINAFHLRSTISAMAQKVSVDVVSYFLMAEARAYQRTRVVFGKFAWGKGSVMRPKALFLPYYANATLIQLILLGPLRSRKTFEVFSAVVVDKTS